MSYLLPGGGTQLWVTHHVPPKRPYFFSLAFTERPPFLPTFIQWPPIFRKFRHFLTKCWEIFGHFGPGSPYFWCISLKDPLFLCAWSLKDLLFWRNLSSKDPYMWGAWWHSYVTYESDVRVLGGTRTSLSYVSAPPPGIYCILFHLVMKFSSLHLNQTANIIKDNTVGFVFTNLHVINLYYPGLILTLLWPLITSTIFDLILCFGEYTTDTVNFMLKAWSKRQISVSFVFCIFLITRCVKSSISIQLCSLHVQVCDLYSDRNLLLENMHMNHSNIVT